MCGICCCLFVENQRSRSNFQVISDSILPHLERRGPDHTGRKQLPIQNDHGTFCLNLTGTVLHLRGSKTPQPLTDDCGNVLLWNGEIFGGLDVKENENDSLVLLRILSSHHSNVTYSQHILSTMAKVQGPWSFVYWQAMEQKLWFGRDYFGRRSLLWHLPSNPDDILAVTSVTERNSAATDTTLHFEEIPADGLYCVDLINGTSEQDCEQPFRINKFEWNLADNDSMLLTCPVVPFNKQMPNEQHLQVIEENRRSICPPKKEEIGGNFTEEREELAVKDNDPREVEERVVESNISSLEIADNIPPSYNLGSKDACLGCVVEQTASETPKDSASGLNKNFCSPHPVSVANVEFNVSKDQSCHECNRIPKVSLDSESSPHSCGETMRHESTRNEASDQANVTQEFCQGNLCSSQWNSSFEEYRDKFIVVLGEAVRKRVFNLPRTCNSSFSSGSQKTSSNVTTGSVSQEQSFASSGLHEKDARVGILFSGGIDSMMIAALADKFVPSDEAIDLINVAFEQKLQSSNPQNKNGRKGKMRQNAITTKPATRSFNVPDRLTGISGLGELSRINPSRQWNFIEVDVTLEELQEMRSRHISHLVSPLNTVLDDSIGCALWFAARGRGRLRSSSIHTGLKDYVAGNEDETYASEAKVLLVGMGADEQLGGYARHRTRFNSEGWSGLMDEMEMEVKRISKRNLGRDDRCISDHGREARFPFLDEDVVSFLNSLPVWMKTDPGLPRGTGEKLLLRQAAKLLGLTSSSELPKRAIQFGSRIAKLESSGEKGSEACSRLEF